MVPAFAAPPACAPGVRAWRVAPARKRQRAGQTRCALPAGARPRPDAASNPPHALPQTIEHALLLAQGATRAALEAAPTRAHARLAVEVPMGRSRRFWYRMSPPSMAVAESATLALHFAQLFRGLRLAVVLGHGIAAAQRVPWVTGVFALDGLDGADDALRDAQVVVVAAAAKEQRAAVQHVSALCEHSAEAVLLFNCFLDVPIAEALPPGFRHAYVCRALDKLAVLREEPCEHWHVFTEIAVFEYEWVGCRSLDESEWQPTQDNVERFAMARGAQRKGINGYFETGYSGCEAGFWPFMTIASEKVAPFDGSLMESAARKKAEKKANKRPFGFF